MAMPSNGTLCESFRALAGKVWRDRALAEKLGVPWNEEAVTEWLLLNLARRHNGPRFGIRAYTRTEESLNGADWEFRFADCKVGVTLRIQAKRLYKSSRYESLFKSGPSRLKQLCKLQSGAGAAFPLYVFYNFPQAFPIHMLGLPITQDRRYAPLSHWGCSVATAEFVKSVNSDCAWQLKRGMVPWHHLVCECPRSSINSRTRQNSLPYRVSAAVSLLEQRSDLKVDKTSSMVEPTDTAPDWVNMLSNGESRGTSDDKLERYLIEQGLRGVVLITENEVLDLEK